MKPNEKTLITKLSSQNNITGRTVYKGKIDMNSLKDLVNDNLYVTATVTETGELTIYIDEFEFDYFT